MKKAQAYILVPLIGMIVFGGIYWNFNAGDEQRQAAKAAEFKKMRNDKLLEDARLREKAVKDAIASQERGRLKRRLRTLAKGKIKRSAKTPTKLGIRRSVTLRNCRSKLNG